ncbi:hypothetical protein DERP_000533 [Dermatophagoides pteronyssinus]|uniref:Uncharacterized protein n=1 Tax=Dermatophagoides pteronyssinus TaxID=6956 RepID=A0ABQ8J0M9_DERPT|nr:hypothetical protein DERP_000533 [Dermatophagoides pteronyssinus]
MSRSKQIWKFSSYHNNCLKFFSLQNRFAANNNFGINTKQQESHSIQKPKKRLPILYFIMIIIKETRTKK